MANNPYFLKLPTAYYFRLNVPPELRPVVAYPKPDTG
jgi:hypothetical protein